MGKSLSKEKMIDEWLHEYRKIESLKDLHYGQIDVMKQQISNSGLHVAMKSKKFQNMEQLDEYLTYLRNRQEKSHPNLVKVIEYFVCNEDKLCSSFSRLLWVMEYFKKDLANEILQRKLNREPFKLEQIRNIACQCISALAHLQKEGVLFTDMRASNILLTEEGIDVKLIHPLFITSIPLIIQVFSSPQRISKGTYLPPNQMKVIKLRQPPINLSSHKAIVFSLGFVLMEACLLKEQDECFDYRHGAIILQKYQINLEIIRKTYGEEICNLISDMTAFNERRRKDFIELDSKYNRPNHMKNHIELCSSKLPVTPTSQKTINSSERAYGPADESFQHSAYSRFAPSSRYMKTLLSDKTLNTGSSTLTDRTPRNKSGKEMRISAFPNVNVSSFKQLEVSKLREEKRGDNVKGDQALGEGKQQQIKKSVCVPTQSNQNENTGIQQTISTGPMYSISFIQQEYFENQMSTKSKSKDAIVFASTVQNNEEESKMTFKLQNKLQNFYSSMRNQNDNSFTQNSLKNYLSGNRSSRHTLQSFGMDYHDDEKENITSDVLKFLKQDYTDTYTSESNIHDNGSRNPAPILYPTNPENTRQFASPSVNGVLCTNKYNPKTDLTQPSLIPIKEELTDKQKELLYIREFDENPSSIQSSIIFNDKVGQTIKNNKDFQLDFRDSRKFEDISEITKESVENITPNQSVFYRNGFSSECQNYTLSKPQFGQYEDNQRNLQPQPSSTPVFEVIQETYEDRSVYNGEKLKGKRHGFGRYSYADGGFYEGTWYDGFMEGYGKLYYPSGKLAYEGDWKRDKFTGQGTVYNDTPQQLDENNPFDYTDFEKLGECWIKYEGGFLDDLKSGHGVIYLTNNTKLIGGFLNDMVEGKCVYIDPNGNKILAHYSQSKIISLL